MPRTEPWIATGLRRAIEAAPGFGHGHGPLDHAITFDPSRLDRA